MIFFECSMIIENIIIRRKKMRKKGIPMLLNDR
jgi:hypothetical protein